MKAYITILGRSIWAVLNSLNAVLREQEFVPDKVFVVTESIFKGKINLMKGGLKTILRAFDIHASIESKVVKEGESITAGNAISLLIKDLVEDGYEVAIDITPGRKSLVAGTLMAITALKLDEEHVKHVYYLDITTIDDVNVPYDLIPGHFHVLRDFMEERGRLSLHA